MLFPGHSVADFARTIRLQVVAQVGATSSFPVDREGRTVAFKLGVNMSNSRIRRIAETSNLMIGNKGKEKYPWATSQLSLVIALQS